MVHLLLAATLVAMPQETTLSRKFTLGEKSRYAVRSSLQVDARQIGLKTAIPQDIDIQYDFTTEVKQMKADGIAVLAYKRPTVTIIEGETFEEPSKRKVEKVNYDLLLTLSPINDIIDVRDLAKKPPAKAGWTLSAARTRPQLQAILGEFMGEVYRLALFTGSFDSALDFSPRLPLDPVMAGDTWKQTVGYQPQKLRGTDKQAVQRLDYTLTYKGKVNLNGKIFERVEATMNLDTDLADFIHQTFKVDSERTGLEKVPLKLQGKILFDLDPRTGRTVQANAETTGSFSIFAKDEPEAIIDEQLKGRTLLKLLPPAAKG